MAPCRMRQVAGVSQGRSLYPILISAATFAVLRDIVQHGATQVTECLEGAEQAANRLQRCRLERGYFGQTAIPVTCAFTGLPVGVAVGTRVGVRVGVGVVVGVFVALAFAAGDGVDVAAVVGVSSASVSSGSSGLVTGADFEPSPPEALFELQPSPPES